MTTFESIDALKEHGNNLLGYSDWKTIEQEQVDRFAVATEDFQAIHSDASAAQAAGFNQPIAHGFLLLSLLPMFTEQAYSIKGVRTVINYGLDKCRFVFPVEVGAKARAEFTLHDIQAKPQGMLVSVDVVVHLQDQSQPALVARTLALLIE